MTQPDSTTLQSLYGLPQHELDSLQFDQLYYDKLSSYDHNVEKNSFSCIRCYSIFNSYSLYFDHLKLCKNKNNSSKENINDCESFKELNENGLFSCNKCPYMTNHKQNLQKHLMTHTGERPFACNLCSYRGSQKHHLDNHMKTHTGEKPFQCQYCDYKGARKDHLKSHIIYKHS